MVSSLNSFNMKRFFVIYTLACCFAIGVKAQNDTDFHQPDSIYEWKDSMSYAEKERWIMSWMNQHYALLAKESSNFDSLKPFWVHKIRECDTYYAIEVIDSTKIFHYTVVSPKTIKSRHKNKNDIVVGHVYYFTLRKLTNYSGKIGCSEVLYDVTFDVNCVKVLYLSSDVLDGPPVCTEDLNGLMYVKKLRKKTIHQSIIN